MPPSPPDISSSPILVYAAIVTALVLAAGTITDKGLGPISRAWYRFAERRRQATVRRDAADLSEMRRQITNLTGLLEANSDRTDKLEDFVVAYVQWGFTVRNIAASQGLTLPEPPRLDP